MTDLTTLFRGKLQPWTPTATEARHWHQFSDEQLREMIRTRYVVKDEAGFGAFGRGELIAAIETWARKNNGREEAR